MTYIDHMKQQLRGHISELQIELDSCNRALGALEGGSMTTVPARQRRRARRNGRRPLDNDAVLRAVKGGTEQATALSRELGVDVNSVRKRLDELQEAGKIRREGERAKTRFIAV